MWIVSPGQDFDVNWVGLGFGTSSASEELFHQFQTGELNGFNRVPSHEDGFKNAITSYDLHLGIKVTASITKKTRAKLEIVIENLTEQPVQVLLQKWEELIEVQENLLRFLTDYEREILMQHEVPVKIVNKKVIAVAVAGVCLCVFAP